MTASYSGDHPTITEAVSASNSLLNDSGFFAAIAMHPSFDLSTTTSDVIAHLMQHSQLELKVRTFDMQRMRRPKRYRRKLAYVNSTSPNTLFLNVEKLNRSYQSIASTIIHESVHALDHAAVDFTFGHGNNSSRGKPNTAPYWIGNLAYKMLTRNPAAPLLAFDETEEVDGNPVV